MAFAQESWLATLQAIPRCGFSEMGFRFCAALLAAAPSISRIATRAPSATNRRAVARPIPRGEAAPEITAVLPRSSMPFLPLGLLSEAPLSGARLVGEIDYAVACAPTNAQLS